MRCFILQGNKMMFENIENDIINLFYGLERGTREDDFNHKDVRITLTNEWVDIKQPSKYNTVPGNIAWLVTVVSNNKTPGALFGGAKYIGLANLFKSNEQSASICIDNKCPWLFLIEREDLIKVIGGANFQFFKTIHNSPANIYELNRMLSLSPERGIYFQPCYKPGASKYFLVITERFINSYPKQLYYKNK